MKNYKKVVFIYFDSFKNNMIIAYMTIFWFIFTPNYIAFIRKKKKKPKN